MTTYLLTAAGVIFLSVIVGFVIPEGKLNKSVNFILRLVCIGVLLQPVTKLFDFSPTPEAELADYDYICKIYSETQSEELEKRIEEELGVQCECSINVQFDDGKLCENGVTVLVGGEDGEKLESIWEYLKNSGYINISVNEKGS